METSSKGKTYTVLTHMSSLLTYPGGTTCTKDFIHLIGRMMSIVPNGMLACTQYPFHLLYRPVARWSDPEVGVTIINYIQVRKWVWQLLTIMSL